MSKISKKTSEREQVRMSPQPRYFMPTALEARHWGATYALYRVRTGMFALMVWPFVSEHVHSLVLQWYTTRLCSSRWTQGLLERLGISPQNHS